MIPVFEMLLIERLIRDLNNPRSSAPAEGIQELAASLKVHGVKVPLICYSVPEGVMIGDGHRRHDAAILLGLKELPVLIFPEKPSEGTLLATQLAINGHREALNPMDEFDAFSRLAKLNSWTPSELAKGLGTDNAEVTRVLSRAKLSAPEQQLLREGKISKSAAYALTRMSPDQRKSMAQKAAAGEVTRDQLNEQARRKRKGEDVKTRRIVCPMEGGTVSVQSETGLNLAGVIELLEELIREFRKGRTQNLDVTTAVRVLRDRRRPQPSV